MNIEIDTYSLREGELLGLNTDTPKDIKVYLDDFKYQNLLKDIINYDLDYGK